MREEIFTAPWIAAWRARLDGSETYKRVAADWETTLVVAAGDRAAFLDLFHGACRGARVATDTDRTSARFALGAEPEVWEELLAGRLDPAAAVMSGALRVDRGSFVALLPFVAAARQLLAEAAEVEASFSRARRSG